MTTTSIASKETMRSRAALTSALLLVVTLVLAIGTIVTASRTVALFVPPAIVAFAVAGRRRAAPLVADIDAGSSDIAGDGQDTSALSDLADLEQRYSEAQAEISRLSAELERCTRLVGALSAVFPIVRNLSDTVIEMSATGSTELTEDVYFLGNQSQKLSDRIAEQLRGFSEGDHSLEGRAAALNRDIRNLQRVSELCVSTNAALANSIGSITRGIDKTHELAAAVMDIADRIGVVAINAAIYAGRAGKLGAGFSVIAREIQDLATDAKETTDAIDEHVTGIQARVGEFREHHIAAMHESQSTLTETVASLVQTSDDIGPRIRSARESISATRTVNEVVTTRLQKINVVMQQHDKIQQIVGHIPDIVEETVETVDRVQPEELPEIGSDVTALVLRIARSKFTMDDEYRAVGLAPPERSTSTMVVGGNELAGDVTLF